MMPKELTQWQNSIHITPHTMEMEIDRKVAASSFKINSGHKMNACANQIMETFLSQNYKFQTY
jgi:hypothetical protein